MAVCKHFPVCVRSQFYSFRLEQSFYYWYSASLGSKPVGQSGAVVVVQNKLRFGLTLEPGGIDRQRRRRRQEVISRSAVVQLNIT